MEETDQEQSQVHQNVKELHGMQKQTNGWLK